MNRTAWPNNRTTRWSRLIPCRWICIGMNQPHSGSLFPRKAGTRTSRLPRQRSPPPPQSNPDDRRGRSILFQRTDGVIKKWKTQDSRLNLFLFGGWTISFAAFLHLSNKESGSVPMNSTLRPSLSLPIALYTPAETSSTLKYHSRNSSNLRHVAIPFINLYPLWPSSI